LADELACPFHRSAGRDQTLRDAQLRSLKMTEHIPQLPATEDIVALLIDEIVGDWKRYGEDGASLQDHYEDELGGAVGAINDLASGEVADEALEATAAQLDHCMEAEFEFWSEQEDD
jgi:hypothetical protein